MFLELRESFGSFEDWDAWASAVPQIRNADYIRETARSISEIGMVDPWYGLLESREVLADTVNYRESLKARGCTSRYRALSSMVNEFILANGWCSTIYLAEEVSEFAEALSTRFPYVLKSEYVANPIKRWKLSHVHHQDPLRLSFPSHAFDLYIAADTMIYAPSMEGFLREARRILRRTGVLLATFPFRYGEPTSEVLAEIVDDKIVHHLEPQYHDDPVDPERRRLLYFTPGWDILDAARSAGFATAEIVAHSSRINAILGAEIAVVFVLKATA